MAASISAYPESMRAEMSGLGFKCYDLQTVEPWFVRSRHSHDEEEIRGAVSGVITFHFDEGPVTIEAGDILMIPAGVAPKLEFITRVSFPLLKGLVAGIRRVTEHADGSGSVEDLAGRVKV